MRKLLPAQTMRGMGIIGCLLILLVPPAIGQNKNVADSSLHLILHNQPVKEALHQIEKQAGVTFHFDKTRIDMTRTVNLDLEKATLDEALAVLAKQTGYQFRQRGDKILIVGAGEVLPPVEEASAVLLKGKVMDDKDQPIQGVSIVVKGTSTGTQTDGNGAFSIKAVRGDVLVASFVGYETKETSVGSAASIAISLDQNKKAMGEVIVTALGIQRQSRELGYSTAKVSSAVINEAKPVNLVTGLSGKVSGLQINVNDNSMDPSTRIVLRGNRSFLGNNQALLIVDGVEVDLSYINYINPNDVDNVTVLKGANAAALYGSDASNGVLIITTKKGVKGKPTITVSSTFTQDKVAYLPELQNSYGPHAGEYTQGYALFTNYLGQRSYIPFEQQAQGPPFNGDSVLIGFPQADGEVLRGIYQAYPNAKYDFFNKGNTWQNDVSYSGADDKGSYFVSFPGCEDQWDGAQRYGAEDGDAVSTGAALMVFLVPRWGWRTVNSMWIRTATLATRTLRCWGFRRISMFRRIRIRRLTSMPRSMGFRSPIHLIRIGM
jgi:TonB-dependent SusC/RagA subfamily outer membrane receptor